MRIRLTASALGLIALGALALQRWPLSLPAIERERSPRAPQDLQSPQALLLVDDLRVGRSAERGRWAELDCSYAWWSALQEEFGATACLSPRALLESGIPATARVLVRSRSLRDDADGLRRLLAWAEAGHLLLLDAPSAADLATLGWRLGAAVAESLSLRGEEPQLTWLQELPRPDQLHELSQLPPHARILLRAGEAPIAVATARGAGALIVCGFDLGRWLQQLRQGRATVPLERADQDGAGRPPRSNLLRADPERLDAWLPRADLLLRWILEGADPWYALPRLGALPAGARGLFLRSYDEAARGAAARALTAARPGASSFFVNAHTLPAPSAQAMLDDGAALQLQWQPQQRRDRALGRWRPLRQGVALHEQLAALQRLLPEQRPPLLATRRFDLRWDEHPTRLWRVLAASAIRLDSSLGPGPKELGWVFESARPFAPLDSNGRPFELLELAVPYRSEFRFDRAIQRRLFEDSQRIYRGVLAPSFSARSMDFDPHVERLEAWLEAADVALQHEHPTWSIPRYLQFRDARANSRLFLQNGSWVAELAGDELVIEWPRGSWADSLRVDDQTIAAPAPNADGRYELWLPAGRHHIAWERR